VSWIVGAAHFDFGLSMWTGRPIIDEVWLRLELSPGIDDHRQHHRDGVGSYRWVRWRR